MTGPHRVLYVGDADRAGAWRGDDRLTVVGASDEELSTATTDVDCVVVDEEAAAASAVDVVRSVTRNGADSPVVSVPASDGDGTTEALVFDAAGGVESVPLGAPDGGGDSESERWGARAPCEDLASFVCDLAAADSPLAVVQADAESATAEPSGSVTDHREKRRALHDVAVDLVSCETDRAAYERAVDAAEDLLDFLDTLVYVREGDRLVPVVAADSSSISAREAEVFGLDEGAIGYTYRTGESVLAADARDHEVAEPTKPEIRSGITVAMGDIGVFNVISDAAGTFDEADLALAETLGAHLTSAVRRIRSEAQTRRERNRFRALFQNVPDAAVVVDRDAADGLCVRRANPAFEEAVGADESAIEGTRLSESLGVPEGESQITLGDDDGVTVRTLRRETADGVRDFLFRGFPVEADSDGRYYAIFTDITERNARKRELERKSQRLEEFADILSHDLRNPLQIANGRLEIVESMASDAQLEHVEGLYHALDRMERLVDDLLTVAREGWTVETRRTLDGERVVERAWDGVSTADATLECRWEDAVTADEARLVEVFENLFRNAVEHAGEEPTVSVRPLDAGDGVVVADDGPGIPAEIRESVFDRGVTGGRGTGLGLAVVDRIVEAHGWTITAGESESGGARFEIRFDADDPAGGETGDRRDRQ